MRMNRPNIFIALLIILLLIVSFSYLNLVSKTQEEKLLNNNLKSKAEFLEKCTSEYIEIGKKVEYCNGATITFHNVQVYQPSPVRLPNGRELSNKDWVAIALDVEVSGKRLQTVDQFKDELILRPDRLGYSKLDTSYFPHITMSKEQTAKPDLLDLWHQIDMSYIDRKINDYPPSIRGWITFILKKDEFSLEEKVDDSFAQGVLLIFDKTSINIEWLLKQLGRPIK